MTSLSLVTLVAPAKLTLTLRVRGVRPDGYHLLESEMVTLDLADSLVVGAGDDLRIVSELGGPVSTPTASTPTALSPSGPTASALRSEDHDVAARTGAISNGPDNLVARALKAVGRTAEVELIKRIPPGAGLGGGSADAAAILRWAERPEVALAAGLGADVPFCLEGGRALVRGIGEDITPLPYEERRFTLLLLPFGVNTAAVYRAWDRLAERGELPLATSTSNDLEAPALVVEPRLGMWKRAFADKTGGHPHLAGSGSTWFIDGWPDEAGDGARQTMTLGGEEALLVPVTTTARWHTDA